MDRSRELPVRADVDIAAAAPHRMGESRRTGTGLDSPERTGAVEFDYSGDWLDEQYVRCLEACSPWVLA